MVKYRILLGISLFVALGLECSAKDISLVQDTTVTAPTCVKYENSANKEVDTLTLKKKSGFFQKVINYFDDANKEKPHKKFDINFIGGPHYASDTKFGLGLVGAGIYRLNGCDSIMQPSNVSLFGDVSTVGFYLLGVRGNTLFPQNRYRLNYALFFYSFPTYYWGIGYDETNNDDNKTKMNRFQAKVKVEFLISIMKNLYIGPILTWDFVKGSKIEGNINLFDGMDLITRNYGTGITLEYDSRDLITNASRGFYFKLDQMFYPKGLWNKYSFSSTQIQTSVYKNIWKGGIFAVQLAATFNYGNPSWAMMAKLGDSNSMRGYYEGRYRDKNMVMGQIELRQHIWRRNGIVVWAATGSVFHDAQSFKHFLPNIGIGYRWEFKKGMNVRLDYGFGKSGQSSFIFNINEAF